MSRHPFVDPITGRNAVLVNDPARGWWDGGVGVEHDDCSRLAEVMPDIDCFYCPGCNWNGRVAGSWVVDIRAAEDGVA